MLCLIFVSIRIHCLNVTTTQQQMHLTWKHVRFVSFVLFFLFFFFRGQHPFNWSLSIDQSADWTRQWKEHHNCEIDIIALFFHYSKAIYENSTVTLIISAWRLKWRSDYSRLSVFSVKKKKKKKHILLCCFHQSHSTMTCHSYLQSVLRQP